jgi:hypothetical protein
VLSLLPLILTIFELNSKVGGVHSAKDLTNILSFFFVFYLEESVHPFVKAAIEESIGEEVVHA